MVTTGWGGPCRPGTRPHIYNRPISPNGPTPLTHSPPVRQHPYATQPATYLASPGSGTLLAATPVCRHLHRRPVRGCGRSSRSACPAIRSSGGGSCRGPRLAVARLALALRRAAPAIAVLLLLLRGGCGRCLLRLPVLRAVALLAVAVLRPALGCRAVRVRPRSSGCLDRQAGRQVGGGGGQSTFARAGRGPAHTHMGGPGVRGPVQNGVASYAKCAQIRRRGDGCVHDCTCPRLANRVEPTYLFLNAF